MRSFRTNGSLKENPPSAISKNLVEVSDPEISNGGNNGSRIKFSHGCRKVVLKCNPTRADVDAGIGPVRATTTCPISPVVTVTETAFPITINGCTSSQIRGFNASDECGNTASTYIKLKWTNDTVPPLIIPTNTTPSPIHLGCNPYGSDIETALGQATATDDCSCSEIIPTYTDTVENHGCNNSKTRTWTAVDTCGNTSTLSRTVTWIDDTNAPVITFDVPEILDGNLGCNPSESEIDDYLNATASDDCSLYSFTYSDVETATGCGYSLTRTWTAVDSCGGRREASRTATWNADASSPTILFDVDPIPGGNLGCNPTESEIDAYLHATANDNCALVSLDYSDSLSTSSNGCKTTLTRTWTAIDACQNRATLSRTATWTNPSTPVLSATGSPSNGIIVGCNPSQSVIENALGSATVVDSCDPDIIIYYSDSAVTGSCTKSQTRTWTATDACGNTSTVTRTATWTADTTPILVATGTPSNGIITTCNPNAATINNALGTATVSNTCDPNIIIYYSDSDVVSGCTTTRTRIWTATNACGLSAVPISRSATWTSDASGPTITITGYTANITACNPTSVQINAAFGTASATDKCSSSGNITITSTDSVVTTVGCSNSKTRTWTATDLCGNSATTSKTVSWTTDTVGPTITLSGGSTGNIGCNPSSAAINTAFGTASATDSCTATGSIVIASTDSAVTSSGCSRSQTRTWTATDLCGNSSTSSKTISWTADTTGPTITCVANKTIACGTMVSFDTPTVSDNCSGTPAFTYVDSVSGNVSTRTWTATDACNNTATCSQSVTTSTCAYKGCSTGFWKNNNGAWKTLSQTIPSITRFITTTSFWTYFGLTPGSCSLPNSLTMYGAIKLGGGSCNNLARQAVAALMDSAAFGSSYQYPPGTSDFATLKAAITAAFAGGCNCSTLATQLATANVNETDPVTGASFCTPFIVADGAMLRNILRDHAEATAVPVASAEMPKRRFLPKNN